MTPLETYLTRVRDIRNAGGGQAETAYYDALSNLFNEYGKALKPKVVCVMQLQNVGAGMPDGGFFTAEQYKKGAPDQPLRGQIPSRGVIEVKPPKDAVAAIAQTEQVKGYVARYGQVLVTNLREFLLVGPDGKLESPYVLAQTEHEFWSDTVAHPRRAAERHAAEFGEFVTRTMLHSSRLAEPSDVAWFLASYARDAKSRVERANLPALTSIRTALEQALGMKFEGEKGEHFFRSTLVQTLFYGLFSAWVLWHKRHAGKDETFRWHDAIWNLRVPMIRSLFEQLAVPTKLQPLGLDEVMDWATAVLNRVDRAVFFTHFKLGHAVQYFYEPFLEAFDPELRKQLGVWYTPPEIVQYMVARVDTVLREELKIEDGLADERVYVLDPCCGTGAYLVEVLNRIHQTLDGKGIGALAAHELKKAAIDRVFGFEILSAPFVVSHLQLGMLLEELGAPLDDRSQERVGVYLTNALTGWEPPKGAKKALTFPEMEEERDLSDKVKRGTEILVVLGNPPYNAFAGVSPEEEDDLVEIYKGVYWKDKINKTTGKIVKDKHGNPVRERKYRLNDPESLGGWGIKKFNLDDLYIRFFRLAERRIAEMTGRGVVSFISNASWVTEPSFVIVREQLLKSFNALWIENLHGNRKISEYAPDGTTSETIFAIDGFSAGIQQGVATTLWLRTGEEQEKGAVVRFRDDFTAARASERRAQILASLSDPKFDTHYVMADPLRQNKFSFRPGDVTDEYRNWPKVSDLSKFAPSNGLMEKRGGSLTDIDEHSLNLRMKAYFDASLDWEAYSSKHWALTKPQAGFVPKKARATALKLDHFDGSNTLPYFVRPFDTRWCYYTATGSIWNRARRSLHRQVFESNAFLVSRPAGVASPEGIPVFYTRCLGDNDALRGHAYYFPLKLRTRTAALESGLFKGLSGEEHEAEPNLSTAASTYIQCMHSNVPGEQLVLPHVLATACSPAYLLENADGIRQDWPRIPLPNSKERLEQSAALGRRIADLLDTECPVAGITSGRLRPEMPVIAVTTGDLTKPEHFEVRAGWGHAGKEGVTMPGKGHMRERDYTTSEREAIATGAAVLGLTTEQALAQLGERTCDVFLNDGAWWSNVPIKVWEYTIGGYQVMKKWLSYREYAILGRPLKPEEVSEVMNMARRIAAILLLQPELDANYEAVKQNTYDWQAAKNATTVTAQ